MEGFITVGNHLINLKLVTYVNIFEKSIPGTIRRVEPCILFSFAVSAGEGPAFAGEYLRFSGDEYEQAMRQLFELFPNFKPSLSTTPKE